MPQTKFEEANPHVFLNPSFTNDLAGIRKLWNGNGQTVTKFFADEIEKITNAVKDIASHENLDALIKNYPLFPTVVRPTQYEQAGCNKSHNLFFEIRLITGIDDKNYGAIGVFFPALFSEDRQDELQLFCRDWEKKSKAFNCIGFYFATYFD